jgi:hypothetical protein
MKDFGEKIFLLSYLFFGVINFTKLYYFIFEMLKTKIWANFQRIIELFTQTIVSKLSKIWVWDPGSEVRDPEKTYSGSRIQGSKRHRIPDPDPQHRLRGRYSSAKMCNNPLVRWNHRKNIQKAMLWIRIGLVSMPIRIQRFRSMRIRIQFRIRVQRFVEQKL